MASSQEFHPDWTSAPGDTIGDILGERGLSLSEFAERLGRTPQDATDLLEGRATITIGTARRLEQVLGGSVEFWMSRDFQYRQDVARLHEADMEWLAELPVGDMIKFGWLRPMPHPSEETEACLRFFGVPSVQAWRQTYADLQRMVVFRKSSAFDSRPAAVAAWLRQGEIEGGATKCGQWDQRLFREALSDVRPLTRERNPRTFIPKLQQLCAAAGVAVVVVRTPNGCRASGATRFLSPDKAVLLLSFRYLSDDQFWFSFFHEAGHLVLHGDRLFLEGAGTPATSEEREANDFAAHALVPTDFEQALLGLPLDGRAAIKFARKIGVSPGIVVGQLQHHGKITYRQLNNLKRRFEWSE
jgi:HTH-type transcriptional regulator / antitoxin HigA